MPEDYNLPLGLDIETIIVKGRVVKSVLADLNKDAEAFGSGTKQAFADAAKSAADFERSTINQAVNFKNNTIQIENMRDALADLKKQAFGDNVDVNKLKLYQTEISKLEKQIEKATNAGRKGFDDLGNKVKSTGDEIKKQSGYYDTLVQRIKIYNEALKQQPNTDKGAKNILALNKSIEKTTEELNRLKNAGTKGFDDLGNKIEQTKTKSEGFVGTLKNIGSVLGITFGVGVLVNFGKELFEIGIKASGIERAFSRVGDSNSLAKLREQTQGFVSDLDLERLTVKANNFNIPIDKLGTFLLFASERAKDTGEDVNKLTDNIIDGLGRKSSRIIDNLGISIVDIQKEFNKVGDFTLAVSNLIDREMGKAGVAVDTLADKANRISASFDNAKTSLGRFLASLLNPDVADNDKIGIITQKRLKTFSDFTKKSAEDRQQIIKDQEARVAAESKFYELTPRKRNGFSDAFTSGSLYDVSTDAARKRSAERLVAEQNILKTLQKQNAATLVQERTTKNILSVEELRAKMNSLTDQATNIVPASKQDTSRRKALLDEAAGIQKQIDDILGKTEKKQEKADDSAAKRRLDRIKELNAERVRLENEYYSAQIAAIEDATTKAVATETVGSQNRVRELRNRLKLYPELTKQINKLIQEEEAQSVARVSLIIKKGEEDDLKARKASSSEIARVLKNETQVQVEEINDRYALIVQNAKKAGTLTTTIEKQLNLARIKEIDEVLLKSQSESLKKQEELELSGIYIRKRKENQTIKNFETQNQIDLLAIRIKFAQKQLALIASDPAKVKEANDLRKAIQDAQNEVDKLKSGQKADLLEVLGIDGDKLKATTDAISKVGELASDIFGSLAEAAQQRVDEIQNQIDAIDELISKQEEQVDKEKELMDKGFANNYENANRQLQAQKAQRTQLLKDQEEAQKKVQDLQRAQIVADGIAQTSNLIVASTEIFKTFSKIPIIGVPLAIAAIAAMFGGFAIAKINAFNAVGTTKLAEGGTAGGKLHSEGGNKYYSMDGNDSHVLEIERGEEITKRSSAEKHRKLLKAINADDFSGLNINDYSLQELLKDTGVIQQLEVAKEASMNNVVMVEQSRTIVVNTSSKSEEYLKQLNDKVKDLEKMLSEKAEVIDMIDYVLIIKGNYTQKLWKK